VPSNVEHGDELSWDVSIGRWDVYYRRISFWGLKRGAGLPGPTRGEKASHTTTDSAEPSYRLMPNQIL